MTKRCTRCGLHKPLSEFHFRKTEDTTHKIGPLERCKQCNKELRGKDTSHRKRLYGIDDEAFDRMLEAQDHACAICRGIPEGKGRLSTWHVDHDHATGKVRAILCGYCNTVLGFAKESPEVLEAGARYLREHGARA